MGVVNGRRQPEKPACNEKMRGRDPTSLDMRPRGTQVDSELNAQRCSLAEVDASRRRHGSILRWPRQHSNKSRLLGECFDSGCCCCWWWWWCVMMMLMAGFWAACHLRRRLRQIQPTRRFAIVFPACNNAPLWFICTTMCNSGINPPWIRLYEQADIYQIVLNSIVFDLIIYGI